MNNEFNQNNQAVGNTSMPSNMNQATFTNNMQNQPMNNIGNTMSNNTVPSGLGIPNNNSNNKKTSIIIIAVVVIVALIGGVYFIKGGNEVNSGVFSESKKKNANYEENIKLLKKETIDLYHGRQAVVLTFKNNNKVDVDTTISVELYDENNNLVDTKEEYIFCAAAGKEFVVVAESYDSKFTNYKYFVDAEKSIYKSYVDKIDIKSSDNGEVYSLQVFNNSDVELDITGYALFYDKNDKLVNGDSIYAHAINPGRSTNKSFEYKDKYVGFEFEKCKVVINGAIDPDSMIFEWYSTFAKCE